MMPSKKDILAFMRAKAGRPALVREIMRQLRIKPQDSRKIKNLLVEMATEGELVRTRGNRYGVPEKMDIVTGTFQAHPSGYGFVIPSKKTGPDVYVPHGGRLDAMDGDTVMVRLSTAAVKKAAGKREGIIIRILERAHVRIVGTFELPEGRTGGHAFVTPSDPRIGRDIFISKENAGKAKPGDIVSAEIVSYPLRGRPLEGRILRIIGRPGDPGIDSDMIIEEYELPVEFSRAALEEAGSIPRQVTAPMIKGRRDLRDIPTVTIDGEKARDFDDAVSVKRTKSGFRLWVHIADVAHYVREGGAIDQEAHQRGTSVYLPDRAIPMLPVHLSNGICSLNPGVDRLSLTVEMDFSPSGDIVKHDIYESVINSNERMTYTAVREILVDREPGQRKRYAHLIGEFELMGEIMEILRARRAKRGSIDFDLPEPEIVLDLQGRMTDIVRAERNEAHLIIEEFMLAANETVALHLERRDIPLIYRIHEEPDEEKTADLIEFLGTIGAALPSGKKLRPIHLRKALAGVKGAPEEALVNAVALRAMKQARYSDENAGHFGLALESYTHFTSPIRRYPDLLVHRIVKIALKGGLSSEEERERVAGTLPDYAAHCSRRERAAMEAERDVVSMLKHRFMQGRLGEEFEGTITGVMPFGFFVQLTEFFVEGLVHVSTLTDDYYHHIEKLHCLRGERRKRVYRVGDRVNVRVDRVDMERKRIDFSLTE